MPHLDEGTIHAWLDGQLPRDEAQAVESHVAECRQCADAVAEARGLIAASSRILTALDSVPRDVIPREASHMDPDPPSPALVTAESRAERRVRRRWFTSASLAAAATIVVAVGTLTLMQVSQRKASVSMAPAATPASVTPGPSRDAAASTAAASVPAAGRQAASAPAAPAAQRPSAALGAARRAIAENAPAVPAPTAANEAPARRDAPAPNAVIDIARAKVAQPAVAEKTQAVDQLSKDDKAGARPARDDSLADSRSIALRSTMSVIADSLAAKPRAYGATIAVTTGSVRGRVVDGNNTGLSGAFVNVSGTQTGVSTSDNGEFALGGLKPGTYRLDVRRIGYAPVTTEVAVAAGQASTADIVLRPTATNLESVVVTGAAATAQKKEARARSAAPATDAAPGAPVTATQSNAAGCYDLGITSSAATRTGFRQMPRRIALDPDLVPANAEGVWYRARDLARTGALPNGLWRPAGPDAVELEWTYGTKTARVRLSGPPGSMMRGSIEEIDRATATGDGGEVVAVRRPCEG